MRNGRFDFRVILAFGALFLLFMTLFLGLGQVAGQDNWALKDQTVFHLPQINDFLANGFRLDYPSTSATTPGSHLIYAAVTGVAGLEVLEADNPLINLVSAAICTATILILVWYVRRVTGSLGRAVILSFPVATSSYFILSSIYAVTEGASYLFWTLALVIGLLVPARHWGGLGFSLAMGGLVAARQIFLPVAVSYAASFILGGFWRRRFGSTALILLYGLIPGLVFLPFYLEWQGLVPPGGHFASFHRSSGLNFDLVHHNFALFGIFAVPYLLVVRQQKADLPLAVRVAAISLVITLISMAMLDVTYAREEGRWGSAVWQISRIGDRFLPWPVLNAGMMFLGLSVFLMGTWKNFAAGRSMLASIMFATYTVALFAQSLSWQRYVEFFALVTLISFAVHEPVAARWRQVLFCLAFLAYGAVSVIAKV